MIVIPVFSLAYPGHSRSPDRVAKLVLSRPRGRAVRRAPQTLTESGALSFLGWTKLAPRGTDLTAPSERQRPCRKAIPRRHRDGAARCISLTAHRGAVRMVHWLPIDLVACGSARLGVLRP